MAGPQRIVMDTNVLVRGIVNGNSASGEILALCDQRRVLPILSKPVLAEYREILTDRGLVARYPELELRKVQRVLARLLYIGDLVREVRVRFAFPRDPKDAKFIELAIAGEAMAMVTCDRDLLDLRHGRDEASRRFRQRLPLVDIVRPEQFVRWFETKRTNPN